MGSSFHSLFLSSILSVRMALKEMIILCLVLVGFIEANPIGKEEIRHKRSPADGVLSGLVTRNPDPNVIIVKDDTDIEEGYDTEYERRKRSPCKRRCPTCQCDFSI